MKTRLPIAPYPPKPKCVLGTTGMKYSRASVNRPLPQYCGNGSPATTILLHTDRRSMISGILSARHTGSLAFRLQKNFIFSNRTRALPQVPRPIPLCFAFRIRRPHRVTMPPSSLPTMFHVKHVKRTCAETTGRFFWQKNVQAQLLYLNAFI